MEIKNKKKIKIIIFSQISLFNNNYDYFKKR